MIFVGNTWAYTQEEIDFTENFIKEKITEEQKIYFYNMVTLFIQEMLQSSLSTNLEFIKNYVYRISIGKVLQNAYDVVCHPCLLDQTRNEWDTFHITKDLDLWSYRFKHGKHYSFWFDFITSGLQYNYYNREDFNSDEDYEAYIKSEYDYKDSLSKLLICATLNNYIIQPEAKTKFNNFYILKRFKHEFPIEKLIDEYIFNLK